MKVVVVLAYLQGFATAFPTTEQLEVYCSTSAQCAADECCVSFYQPDGRRRTVVEHLETRHMRFVDGSCHKNGTSGSKCFVHELSTGTSGLFYDCPCTSGYKCQGSGMVEVPLGETGTCQVAAVTVTSTLHQPCASGADCSDNECCVNDDRPIGKRSLTMGYAHCQSMGLDGSGCLVRYGSGKPNGTVFRCPCSSGLTCHGNHVFDMPLGETGTCGA
ncbi:uncharacterized protein LOC127879642 [Dreissena polymorpha]|uniref:uncharacterized protein LOC127879642 n=1 Tax=Dreissena polymorpha TaxID=45954 RepID=UPI0022650E46|nr:uncharacterized protein LOC127879642 [Dreissena polymorpha]